MAKQAGDFFIEGTIDDLTFYRMKGLYYVRMKSCLNGERFWRAKCFEGSRKSASRFGEGNRLASVVFQVVAKERRTNRLFPFLRKRAIALLKEEKCAEEVIHLLLDYLIDFGFIAAEPIEKINIPTCPEGVSTGNRSIETRRGCSGRDVIGLSRHFADSFILQLNSS